MNPVLIFTDTRKISDEKAFLTKGVTLYQAVYNALKAIGITANLEEISALVSYTVNRNGGTDFVKEFAINKLLDLAAPYVLNGIPLSRDKVRDMMVVPDVSGVIAALSNSLNVYSYGFGGTRLNLISIANDVITKVVNSDAQIELMYTYYTKTDASATLATNLLTVCAAMNTFNANNNNVMLKNLSGIGNEQQFDIDLPGIAIFSNSYVPSLKFIRTFEARQAA